METILTIIAVPLINLLVIRGKKLLNLSGEITLVIVAIFVGLLYTLIQALAPTTFIEHAHEFASKAGFFAVLVYEFLLKKYKDKPL